jgi:hypothetical protein
VAIRRPTNPLPLSPGSRLGDTRPSTATKAQTFTPQLLLALREKGVRLAYCTLHIGLDTFKPVHVEQVEMHPIHTERAVLTADNARIVNEAKLAGGRLIAVGTTSARTLETAAILSAGGDPARPLDMPDAGPWRPVIAFERDTELFIYPGYRWRAVDALVTNFHLPRSTLLMMVSAFAGRERILSAYEVAKRKGYRFFSFGDAMLSAEQQLGKQHLPSIELKRLREYLNGKSRNIDRNRKLPVYSLSNFGCIQSRYRSRSRSTLYPLRARKNKHSSVEFDWRNFRSWIINRGVDF